jgi:hypothetical protein
MLGVMSAESSRRRRALIVAAVVALVGIGATGLVVAFRDDGASTVEGRDEGEGERLSATLVVRVEDEALADVTATLTLRNESDRPAFYAGNECAGPGDPRIGPVGAGPGGDVGRSIDATGPVRERLIAAGRAAQVIGLGRASGEFCEMGLSQVRIDPGDTQTWEYRSGEAPVDRSAAVRAVTVVDETTRTGRSLGRIRLVIPFPDLPEARGLSIDQAVDAFLGHPDVVALLRATGEDGVLTVVSREGDVWTMNLGSSRGDLSGEVHPDLTVSDVRIADPPR